MHANFLTAATLEVSASLVSCIGQKHLVNIQNVNVFFGRINSGNQTGKFWFPVDWKFLAGNILWV